MTINKDQLSDLITETLEEIGMNSTAAVNLLMGTAAQESHLGTYIRQVKGPALGIFQMEPATHDDIWKNYVCYKGVQYTGELLEKASADRINPNALVYNLKYAIIMSRLHYRRIKEALPKHNDVDGLAKYWKEHYNTYKGAGTVEEFIKNYARFVA